MGCSGRPGLAGEGEVVADGGAIAGRQVELFLLRGLELDAEPPDRLTRHAIGQHVRARHDVGELEAAVLAGPEDVAFLLRRAVRLPDQEELQPTHGLWSGALL